MRGAVLVHGWAFGPGVWPARLEGALGERLPVRVADLTGSSPPAYADLVLDLGAGGPSILVGWSLGALACLEAALRAPDGVAALVLAGATARFLRGPGYAGGQPRATLRLLRARLARDPSGTLSAFARDMLAPAERGLDLDRRLLREAWPDPRHLAEGLAYLGGTDLLDRLARVRAPALILHGAEDPICPVEGARELARRMPRARIRILEGAGHAPFLTQPARFEEEVLAFLDGTGTPPAPDGSVSARRVRRRFERSASTYDEHAVLQREAAEEVARAARAAAPGARAILEIGAGTGLLTERLRARFPGAAIAAVDPAEALLRRAEEKLRGGAALVLAEAERLPFEADRFDLVASGATLQWVDLRHAAGEIARVLRPGGRLAFSAVLGGTFPELREALRRLRGPGAGPPVLRPAADYAAALASAGIPLGPRRVRTRTLRFPSARAFLASLRGVGATGMPVATPLRRREVEALVALYDETFREEDGVPATYAVLYAIGRKGRQGVSQGDGTVS